MARACYFVQSHRNPAQVARLVDTIKRASPSAYVVVGHDARACRLTRADLPAQPDVELFEVDRPVERGRLSLLAPYLLAVERLARDEVDYDWLVYLSGQDYPTAPLARTEASWRASDADGFLTYWAAFEPVNPWGRRRQGVVRYGYQYHLAGPRLARCLPALRFVNRLQSHWHLHLTYGPFVGVRQRRTPFGAGFVCYAGSQWTTLRRACVEHLKERFARERELLAYYERCICADESIVQTLLVNSGRFRLVADHHRYMDFTGSRTGSPRTLTCADLDTLAAERYQFARKFDAAVDGDVLDRLDTRIFA